MKKDIFYSITANGTSWNTESKKEAKTYFAKGAKIITVKKITIKEDKTLIVINIYKEW